jgi:hypothetical protein
MPKPTDKRLLLDMAQAWLRPCEIKREVRSRTSRSRADCSIAAQAAAPAR